MLSATATTRLKDIVGDDGITDENGVVAPKTAEEVAQILAFASEEGIPVTPRGAGTGISGGSIPAHEGLVLATIRMNHIVSISAEDLIAVVEPGVGLEDFRRRLESQGLFYPPDNATLDSRTLGGTVGESTRGLRAVKYGGTKNYVMGMRVALSGGEIIRTGAKTLKCVVGYDLARLLTGSLGTLGVCTELFLKVLPSPEVRIAAVAAFDDLAGAAQAALRILEAGVVPSILELMDQVSVEAVKQLGNEVNSGDGGPLLLTETDGLKMVAERDAGLVEDICCSSGARSVVRFAEQERAAGLWHARRSIFSALCRKWPGLVLEDLQVPRSKVVDLAQLLAGLRDTDDLEGAVFGHLGEGRLHVGLPAEVQDRTRRSHVEEVVERISAEVMTLDGRLGPETIVPRGDPRVLRKQVSPGQLDLMKRLKETLDPSGIMNPGKVF